MTTTPYTVASAAVALGVSARRVRQLIAEGVMPATRHGRDWLITAAALAEARGRNTIRGGAAGQRGTRRQKGEA